MDDQWAELERWLRQFSASYPHRAVDFVAAARRREAELLEENERLKAELDSRVTALEFELDRRVMALERSRSELEDMVQSLRDRMAIMGM